MSASIDCSTGVVVMIDGVEYCQPVGGQDGPAPDPDPIPTPDPVVVVTDTTVVIPEPTPTTTAVVAQSAPPVVAQELPVTGFETPLVFVASAMIVVGTVLRIVTRKRRNQVSCY